MRTPSGASEPTLIAHAVRPPAWACSVRAPKAPWSIPSSIVASRMCGDHAVAARRAGREVRVTAAREARTGARVEPRQALQARVRTAGARKWAVPVHSADAVGPHRRLADVGARAGELR